MGRLERQEYAEEKYCDEEEEGKGVEAKLIINSNNICARICHFHLLPENTLWYVA